MSAEDTVPHSGLRLCLARPSLSRGLGADQPSPDIGAGITGSPFIPAGTGGLGAVLPPCSDPRPS